MTRSAEDPGEAIAAIPTLLGYPPVNSVVVVGVGVPGRLGPLARIDSADCTVPDLTRHVARSVTSVFSREGVSQVVVVGFGSGADRGPTALHEWELAGESATALADALRVGLRVLDVWVVNAGRYRSPECPDLGCCPPMGRPLPPARRGTGSSTMAAAHGVTLAAAEQSERRKATRAAARVLGRREADVARWRLEGLELWRGCQESAMDGALPTAAMAGRLAGHLRDVVVRDALVISMVPGRESVARALCCDPKAAGVRDALDAMVAPRKSVTPELERLEALGAVCEHVASLAPALSAAPLTVAGMAAWWSGRTERAATLIRLALEVQPEYRLAEIVACAVRAGMSPGWLSATTKGAGVHGDGGDVAA